MRFGIWNVSSLYGSESITSVTTESARNKLDLVGVQEVSWDKGGNVREGDYIFSMETRTKIISLEQDFLVHHRIFSAVKTVEFVTARMLYTGLRGRWCNIIVLNVHVPSGEEK